MKCSIIIAVLESYDVVRRQILHLNRIMPPDFELIIVDDGSDPPIEGATIRTGDSRPWSQPAARNRGAEIAKGEYILFTDIDHILTIGALEFVSTFKGDKLVFPRAVAIIGDNGYINRSMEVLIEYGHSGDIDELLIGPHFNTFAIRSEIFKDLGGYDEKFCGSYGGDDTEFAKRYAQLVYRGEAERSVQGPYICVYPDPRRDVKQIFHSLRRKR